MEDIVVGIDLGTTNSCAACYRNGSTKILENAVGGRTTPSVVYFTDKNQVIVGEIAKKMGRGNPKTAVYEIKRLVGREKSDPYVQKNLKYYPFKIDESSEETTILIQHSDHSIKRTPLEISAVILKALKADIEQKLGFSIEKAVITVPAYFNVKQREVTLGAAKDAGFTVLKLLNEPTAAALTYYSGKIGDSNNGKYSLVYDLGGGTFDVAILKLQSPNIVIIGVDGDSHLGGQDFDNLIIDYVCNELRKHYNFDEQRDKTITIRRLRNMCEEAKKEISVTDETSIIIEIFVKDQDYDMITIQLKKTQFEEMADHLFQKTIRIIDRCLKRCNLSKEDIDKVILAGGSTRIPKIPQLLVEYFGRNILSHEINPDECVAEGAALHAAMLSNNPSQKLPNLKITDVTSLSVGVKKIGDIMSVMIPRNTPIPVSVSKKYSNVYDKQTAMSFRIFEGERKNAAKNNYLGNLEITDLTPAPPRKCKVAFTMTIDKNGILTCSAKEKYKNNVKELKVSYTRGHRNDSEINSALQDAETHKDEDEEFLKLAELKSYILDYCVSAIHNFEKKNLIHMYKDIYELCKNTQLLVEIDADESNIRNYLEIIESQCGPIVQLFEFELMPQR